MPTRTSTPPAPRDLPAWIVTALAATFVVVAPNVGMYYSEIESYDVWRYLQVALVVALAGIFVFVPAAGRMVLISFAALPARVRSGLGIVAALGTVSALAAERPLYALREVALFVLLFLVVISVAAAAERLGTRFHETAAGAVALAAIFYLTLFLAVLLFDPWGTRSWSQNPFVGFANPRFFGQLESWTLPLMVLPLRFGRGSPLSRAGFWAAGAGWWMLLLVSGSRAPMLSLGVACGVAVACYGRAAIPWLRMQAWMAAGGVAAYNLLPGLSGSVQVGIASAMGRGVTSTGRTGIWLHALELIRHSPLLGVGPANYAHLRVPSGGSAPAGDPAHPHNALLQIGAEWGVPAAVIAAAILLWGLAAWLRARRSELRAGDAQADLAVALTVALVAGLVHSCFDGMTVIPLPQTLGAVVIGWALGVHLSRRTFQEDTPTGHVWPLLARAGILVAAAALVATLRLPVAPLGPTEQRQPAFWVHGPIP